MSYIVRITDKIRSEGIHVKHNGKEAGDIHEYGEVLVVPSCKAGDQLTIQVEPSGSSLCPITLSAEFAYNLSLLKKKGPVWELELKLPPGEPSLPPSEETTVNVAVGDDEPPETR